jgi:Cdc6-like AAA superfamily ATPase
MERYNIVTNPRSRPYLLLTLIILLISGCSINQIQSSVQFEDISLSPRGLESQGVAFITPSTVTGREQDIQALAFIFADILQKERPDIKVVSLPETLSAINRAGLADEYQHMYVAYSNTGIFKKDALRMVGQATGVRYLAQLKLASFQQDASGRFGIFGLRLVKTHQANIRLFLQIWNSEEGSIVWEATEELNYAWDTLQEKPVSFQLVVEEIARNLIQKFPQNQDSMVN